MSPTYETVTLDRECRATVIPGGQPMVLHPGEAVVVTQTLGDSVTVQTQRGYLVRLNPADSAALGLADAPRPAATVVDASKPFDVDDVVAVLKNVFDPEIPINVVDLGLIYRCEAMPLPDGGQRVEIDMSMTAPGCGMGDILRQDAAVAAGSVAGVTDVQVELVWDPPWGLERISDAARLQLGLL
ncbi:MAG TPA: iron-sulfur cluster assembly protein [Mycobacteriales bacterium]